MPSGLGLPKFRLGALPVAGRKIYRILREDVVAKHRLQSFSDRALQGNVSVGDRDAGGQGLTHGKLG